MCRLRMWKRVTAREERPAWHSLIFRLDLQRCKCNFWDNYTSTVPASPAARLSAKMLLA